MVMLAKSLALEPAIGNPVIVLVTDRVDLDEQIWKTFHQCGKEPVQAQTGKHLAELIMGGTGLRYHDGRRQIRGGDGGRRISE